MSIGIKPKGVTQSKPEIFLGCFSKPIKNDEESDSIIKGSSDSGLKVDKYL